MKFLNIVTQSFYDAFLGDDDNIKIQKKKGSNEIPPDMYGVVQSHISVRMSRFSADYRESLIISNGIDAGVIKKH